MAEPISDVNLKWAVDITIATVGQSQGAILSHPELVTKFIEDVSKKIQALRNGTA